jgi:hypothetical protein
MRTRPLAASIALALCAAAAPSAAQAATLAPNKSCYGGGDSVKLAGAGFTPGAPVTVAVNGSPFVAKATANPAGAFTYPLKTPYLSTAKEVNETFTATDGANAANVGTAIVRRSIIFVSVKPANGNPRRIRRFRARGFTMGRSLYVHIIRHGKVGTKRLGKLHGACKTLSVRRRLFRRSAHTGTYRVVFDVARRYKKTRAQRVVFRVRVHRVRRSSAAAASAAETWTRVSP